MKPTLPYLFILFLVFTGLSGRVELSAATPRPNVLLIMVDDLGFSDLGFHGGEIATPNLDALASGGVRFSQFYNAGRCCPTRATLMTGLHPHQTGIGHMTNPSGSSQHDRNVPGYRGYLNDRCVTVAEVLRSAGYATLMTGKWHLGYDHKECWPLQRGFDKYYGCVEGATRFFHPVQPRGMVLGNESIEVPESTTDGPFYTTDAFTDQAIAFLGEHRKGERSSDPFFLYLAYTAPHWPLQAFEDDIAKYRGQYKIGWDELRKQRYARQIELGLIDSSWPLSPRTEGIPAWDSLDAEKQDEMDLKMAVFAAMVDRVDQNIGKLTNYLKQSGVYDNTLILFLSDNGACQEGGILGRGEFYDVEKRNLETANSYGEAWANASSTPFRLYKHFLHEGGAATPFFMHWPAQIKPTQRWYSSPAQLIDILPTIIDVASASYPSEMRGNPIPPLEGISLRPAFEQQPLVRSAPLFMEHENNAAIRDGDYKLVGKGVAERDGVLPDKWELYQLSKDRTELNDLAGSMPEKVREMAAKWDSWATRVGVYPKVSSLVATNDPPREGDSTADVPATRLRGEPNPPLVKGKPFVVSATIRNPRPHGVVVSHGGTRHGYALHFVEGRPAFSVRHDGKRTELIADKPIRGRATVRATLSEEVMSIAVDDQIVATQKSPGLLSAQPAIGLFVGLDFKDPVGNYEAPNAFRGRLIAHEVIVGDGSSTEQKVSMRSTWGEQLEQNPVALAWTQYPRPGLRRPNWLNLNGSWDYAITSLQAEELPDEWQGKIRVPFSIESPLSGVEKRITPDDALWYRRTFNLRKKPDVRYQLNFEAVDYQSVVWVNGVEVGRNTGGNLPFSFDITGALVEGENTVAVRVTDATDTAYQLHGKQVLEPEGIWYTPVSGIWQTVWMEEVPPTHITSIKVVTQIDGNVTVEVGTNGQTTAGNVRATLSLDDQVIAMGSGDAGRLALRIADPKLWSPESPTLYDLEVTAGDDVIRSYVGVRGTSIARDAQGHLRLMLNDSPIFHWGTLDQGWWPDGLLTPPSEEAMVSDIQFLKDAGFNTIRKHIKVEPRLYYYHCDRLGMMVWQDQVSSGTGRNRGSGASSAVWTRLQPDPIDAVWPDEAHRQFMAELKSMIDSLHHHPSIVQWVPFNEAWGQHRTMEVGQWTVDYDPTRQVNVASGGNWFPAGHIVDHHQYPHPSFPFELGEGGRFDDYVKVVGEFGGHGYPVEGHLWSTQARNWGYGGLPKDREEWIERYRESIRGLAALRERGIAAGIYTQTTDVEGEINGLLTYDRRVSKLPAEVLREIHVEAGLATPLIQPSAVGQAGAASEKALASRQNLGSQPNIVVFLSDDHTSRDSSVYGSPDIDTPNMARLAKAGVTFDNAFVASPTCAPSRAALLTGLYPARNGAEANHSQPRDDLKKLPAYLQELGYEVAAFGKVGHYRQTPDYGFDTARHFGYHEDVAVPEALRWLSERDDSRPLCLFVGTNWPHVPWPDDIEGIDPNERVVPPNHVDNATTRERRAHYVAAIGIMDRELGQVFDLAREKLGDNTFFLHTSDHGAQWPFGKWNLYDDGIRTPLIASWPGKITPGTRSPAMVSWMDILPTLVDVAGGSPPTTIDGRSFLPALKGQTQSHRDLIFTTHSGDGNNNVYPIRAVSSPDGWKYIRNLHPDFRFTSHVTTKPGDTGYWPSWIESAKSDEDARRKVRAYQQRPSEELFHVHSDPYEQNNLIEDPSHVARLANLRASLDAWLDQTADPQSVFGTPTFLAQDQIAVEKPNVVMVFIDDMGWSDLSCFGGKTTTTTNIDRLAAEGIRFNQFYVNSPICSPSRVALATGQYPHRWRITSYLAHRQLNDERGMAQWLDPKAPMLSRQLKQAGYATGHFGKWHMGGQRDVGEAPLIPRYGFDRSLTNFEGLGPRVLPLKDAYDGKPPVKHALGSDNLGRGPIRWEDRSVITAAFVKDAVSFIDDAQSAGQPFYINLWPDDVHGPFFPPEVLRRESGGGKRALYYAVLKAMDDQLATLFDRVRNDDQLRNNTLILIASDNGHEEGAGQSDPLRGAKTWLYEGGIRSPLIVWGPGLSPAGAGGLTNDASILCALDLNRSLYTITGADLPKGVTLDGEDLSPTLLGRSADGRQAPIFWRRPPDRPGTPEEDNPDLAVRDGKWKFLINYDGSDPQLYDLNLDQSESNNVSERFPQISARLRKATFDWNAPMPQDAGAMATTASSP